MLLYEEDLDNYAVISLHSIDTLRTVLQERLGDRTLSEEELEAVGRYVQRNIFVISFVSLLARQGYSVRNVSGLACYGIILRVNF